MATILPGPQCVNPELGKWCDVWIFIEPSGGRFTKAYDVTNQRYRNSHAKIEDSKMPILRSMG